MTRPGRHARYHAEPGAEDAPQTVVVRGRGALSNRSGRYESWSRDEIDDGWGSLDASLDEIGSTATSLQVDSSRRVIARNVSPDVPFDRSINPYRGCEHGCIYCYARPTHAWLGLSPGRDFETKLFYKPDTVALLRRELGARGYRPAPIALGANTDPYQPVERRLRLTRGILELLKECSHPAMIVTKSVLIERDTDFLAVMASEALVNVSVSVTTLDDELSRRMEPRAAGPRQRLATVERLSRRGIPVSVLVAPIIPGLTDHEIESILRAARSAGARDAAYVLLRLPLEIAGLFHEWLDAQYPLRAPRVRSLIRQTAGGRVYQGGFGTRMRGTGQIADLVANRFAKCRRRLGVCAAENSRAGILHQDPGIAQNNVRSRDLESEFGRYSHSTIFSTPPSASGSVLRRTLLGFAGLPELDSSRFQPPAAAPREDPRAAARNRAAEAAGQLGLPF